MKRRLPKSVVDQAKFDLREKIIKRIVKGANSKGCWHLKSVDGSKIIDAVCHFRDKGGRLTKGNLKYAKVLISCEALILLSLIL